MPRTPSKNLKMRVQTNDNCAQFCYTYPVTNPVLTVAPQNKEDTTMSGATNKITALYCRLSQEDERLGESLSIENQDVICRGWFLPPNTIT